MRFYGLGVIIAEAKDKTEVEFAKLHPNVAIVVERFVPAPTNRMTDDPTWIDTTTELPTLRTHEQQERLDPKSRIFWVEGSTRFPQPVFHIGRDASFDIALPHPRVSRHHATIQRLDSGEWIIEDHGSPNGTMLNGQALALGQERRLEDGDVLLIGQVAVIRPFFSPVALYRSLLGAGSP